MEFLRLLADYWRRRMAVRPARSVIHDAELMIETCRHIERIQIERKNRALIDQARRICRDNGEHAELLLLDALMSRLIDTCSAVTALHALTGDKRYGPMIWGLGTYLQTATNRRDALRVKGDGVRA